MASAAKTTRSATLPELVGPEHKKFLNLLLAQDMRLVRALLITTETPDVPAVARSLAHVFETSGKGMLLINTIIENEILLCADPASLFGPNSVGLAVLSAYCNEVGTAYLQATLRLLFLSITYAEQSPNLDDPEHVSNLIATSQMFIAKILRSAETLPLSIRYLIHQTLSRISRKFPELAYKNVGVIFFSKYICRAILNPESFGLVTDQKIGPSHRHILLVIAKILQSLATGEACADPQFRVFDAFIAEQQAGIIEFYEALATPPKESGPSKEILSLVEPDVYRLSQILRHLRAHSDRIARYFQSIEATFYLDQYQAILSVLPDDINA